jgi:hypothetical protein
MDDNQGVTSACSALRDTGFVWIRSAFDTPAAAFAKSHELIEECTASDGHDPLSVIGDFVLPPPDGEATRDFQTLHFDFGIPLRPLRDQDVARYTALFIPRSVGSVTAVTRLVPLNALLSQRLWPDHATVLAKLIAYGESHGAGFLCGMEFDDLAAELSFFKSLELDVEAVQTELPLRPGDLLVFDNLAVAHGRRGGRAPGELHQRVYGQRSLPPVAQRALRDGFLTAFGRVRRSRHEVPVSLP